MNIKKSKLWPPSKLFVAGTSWLCIKAWSAGYKSFNGEIVDQSVIGDMNLRELMSKDNNVLSFCLDTQLSLTLDNWSRTKYTLNSLCRWKNYQSQLRWYKKNNVFVLRVVQGFLLCWSLIPRHHHHHLCYFCYYTTLSTKISSISNSCHSNVIQKASLQWRVILIFLYWTKTMKT